MMKMPASSNDKNLKANLPQTTAVDGKTSLHFLLNQGQPGAESVRQAQPFLYFYH